MPQKVEFGERGIPFRSQQELVLTYKGRTLKKTYQPDFTCLDKIIVEIKAVSELNDEHRAQVHNYLKATGCRLGLLVNFGADKEMKYGASFDEYLSDNPIREIREIRKIRGCLP